MNQRRGITIPLIHPALSWAACISPIVAGGIMHDPLTYVCGIAASATYLPYTMARYDKRQPARIPLGRAQAVLDAAPAEPRREPRLSMHVTDHCYVCGMEDADGKRREVFKTANHASCLEWLGDWAPPRWELTDGYGNTLGIDGRQTVEEIQAQYGRPNSPYKFAKRGIQVVQLGGGRPSKQQVKSNQENGSSDLRQHVKACDCRTCRADFEALQRRNAEAARDVRPHAPRLFIPGRLRDDAGDYGSGVVLIIYPNGDTETTSPAVYRTDQQTFVDHVMDKLGYGEFALVMDNGTAHRLTKGFSGVPLGGGITSGELAERLRAMTQAMGVRPSVFGVAEEGTRLNAPTEPFLRPFMVDGHLTYTPDPDAMGYIEE